MAILKLLTTRAGLIATTLAVVVLAVGLISYNLIQYGASIQRLQTEVQRYEQQIQTRQRIDKAIRDNSGFVDPDGNREWLRQRNQSRQ
jgi:hypothetical protein